MAVQRLSIGLGSLVVALYLMVALFASGSHGQIVTLGAPALGTNPSNDEFVTYFGDTQNTSAIGSATTLPQCAVTFVGQSNLILRLENTNTGLVLQQVGPFTSQSFLLWDTAANATLTPSLTGSYVCRLYYNSMVAKSGDSYQLNVVVPMSITCQYPPNLRYESLNVLSCTVTGYPLPSISWTHVNGSNVTTSSTLNGGIHQVTSTMSFLGNQTRLAAGLLITISTTAKYPTFNCTPLQTPTAMNICDSTNTSVTVTSEPLQIVAPCPDFNNISFSPPRPPGTEYATQFNIGCAAGYTGSSRASLQCQASGTWSTFPTCIDFDECGSMPCQNNGTCMNEVAAYYCVCPRGYTGTNCETYAPCLLMPCNDTDSTCRDTGNGNFACDCPAGKTGDGEEDGGCVNVMQATDAGTSRVPSIVTRTHPTISSPPTPPDDKPFSIGIIIGIVLGVVLALIVISGIVYCVKYHGRNKPDTGPSPKSKQVAETDDQYDTCVHGGNRPPQVTDPSADPDHYDTFVRPDQQEPGTASSTRPDTYDHIVLNKSIPAEGETYDHLDREQVLAITQGQQPGQQSAAATALSTQQAGNPRVDTSYSMVDMSKKKSRPLFV